MDDRKSFFVYLKILWFKVKRKEAKGGQCNLLVFNVDGHFSNKM